KPTVVAGDLTAQSRVVGRRLDLAATRQRLLDLLRHDDVGVVRVNLGQRRIEADRRTIGIGVVPDLPKLHVELKNAEAAHGAGHWLRRAAAGRRHDRRTSVGGGDGGFAAAAAENEAVDLGGGGAARGGKPGHVRRAGRGQAVLKLGYERRLDRVAARGDRRQPAAQVAGRFGDRGGFLRLL